jgi:hypothetical protein
MKKLVFVFFDNYIGDFVEMTPTEKNLHQLFSTRNSSFYSHLTYLGEL